MPKPMLVCQLKENTLPLNKHLIVAATVIGGAAVAVALAVRRQARRVEAIQQQGGFASVGKRRWQPGDDRGHEAANLDSVCGRNQDPVDGEFAIVPELVSENRPRQCDRQAYR